MRPCMHDPYCKGSNGICTHPPVDQVREEHRYCVGSHGRMCRRKPLYGICICCQTAVGTFPMWYYQCGMHRERWRRAE